MRRRLVIVGALAVLVLLVVVAWELADMPPFGFVLRYGYPSPMAPTGRTVEIEGVEFVEISPGYFRMGSHYHCEEGDVLGVVSAALGLPWGRQPVHHAECPVHWVEFANGFWIARTEVTNEQYETFDPRHPRSRSSLGNQHPVMQVSWTDARQYCAWLSNRSGLPVRLPSEAEWESACRAGSDREFCFGEDEAQLSSYGWFGRDRQIGDLAALRARRVATKQPNRWGLSDLHGNVWELCGDAWHDSYDDAPDDGSPWVDGGTPDRVERGGSYGYSAACCRSATRFRIPPAISVRAVGFRPAFTLPAED